MIRKSLVAAAALVALASPAHAGQPVALKTQPAAGSGGVTLGDLFDGASGPAAKVVVAPAPAAGTNTVLEAGRIQLAAHAAGLDWDNALGLRRITVTGAPPAGSARVAATTGARPARRVQTLAYTRNIMAGEIVGPQDLEWSEAAIASVDAPGDADSVIGMAARRPLRQGAAVSARDLAAPIVVRRDETIAVSFQQGGISLTLHGKALKDAGVGDSVQVLNPQSKKVIDAVVSGAGRALVGPAAEALKARTRLPFSTAFLR
jgi:flagella basal body P-ring formation protein FlgA